MHGHTSNKRTHLLMYINNRHLIFLFLFITKYLCNPRPIQGSQRLHCVLAKIKSDPHPHCRIVIALFTVFSFKIHIHTKTYICIHLYMSASKRVR